MKHREIYCTITNQFIRALYEGAPPWIRPWRRINCSYGRPMNALSGRKYSGINIPILWSAASTKKYDHDLWLTFKQVSRLNGRVRRGQKGTLVVMYRQVQIPKRNVDGIALKGDNGQQLMSTIKLMRGFTLFNIDQCSNLPDKILQSTDDTNQSTKWDSHAAAEELVQSTGANICHHGNNACYYPRNDQITIPPRTSFATTGGYYSTVLHELVHWTGSHKRLARPGITSDWIRDSPEYAFEELVAEIGAAYLCADLGIPGRLRHEGYVLSWIKSLEHDPRAIFRASNLASQAASYIFMLANGDNRPHYDVPDSQVENRVEK